MSDNNRDSTVPGYGNIEIPENKSTSVTFYNPEHPEFEGQDKERDINKREFYEAIHRMRDALGGDMKFVIGKWARMLDNLERGEDVDDGIEMLKSVFQGYVDHEIEILLEGKTGLSAEIASELHRGVPIEDGSFTLTYDVDSEGFYYLEYNKQDPVEYDNESTMMKQRCHFKRVERTGENTFNLAELDQRSGVYLTIGEEYDTLFPALVTLSNVTPDEVKGE